VNEPPITPGHHAAAAPTLDGTRVLVPAVGGVAVLELATKARRGLLAIEGDVWRTVTGPGERAVVIADKAATLFDLATHAPISSLSAQGEVALEARFSNDGRYVYTRSSDFTVRRWDAASGELEAASVDEEHLSLARFALHPADALMATFADSIVSVWDTRTGKLLAQRDLTPDVKGVGTVLAFAPGGKLVASSYSGVLWTWTLPSWQGTTQALDAMLARDVPWTLVDGRLKPRVLTGP
ncbi:MAG TPA: hypothetical protein VM513_06900, partial [Kofleriaceae bacterium]|nr:hypothetical protein [Kofleriaceae bacterium]